MARIWCAHDPPLPTHPPLPAHPTTHLTARAQAAAFDEEEIAAAEEALRLGQELDDREDEEASERERADLDLAREMLAADETTEAVRAPPAPPARAAAATRTAATTATRTTTT